MQVEAIYYYDVEDKDCAGDYHIAELRINGEVALLFDDYYHDKSDHCIEALKRFIKWQYHNEFIDTLELNILPDKHIADSK